MGTAFPTAPSPTDEPFSFTFPDINVHANRDVVTLRLGSCYIGVLREGISHVSMYISHLAPTTPSTYK